MLTLFSRRAALVALVAPSEGARRVSQARAPPKFRSSYERAPACEAVEERAKWAEDSERFFEISRDAELAGRLYAALSEGDMSEASDIVEEMRESGRLDLKNFEDDVRLARLKERCYDA